METPEEEYFFGIPLSTHRDRELGPDTASYFLYEALIAAISIGFFRSTVHWKNDPKALRWFFASVLAFLAYWKKSYKLISAVEMFSYAVPWFLSPKPAINVPLPDKLSRLLLIALSGLLSMIISHYAASGDLLNMIKLITPNYINKLLHTLIPIDEIYGSYDIMAKFQDPVVLNRQVCQLLFVTFHIQFGIGYLGIAFLTKEQQRRNELVRMDTPSVTGFGKDGTVKADKAVKSDDAPMSKLEKARRFQKSAPPFILLTAVPYMARE